MASINYAAREINVKIVYYGPGLSGKTTNLQVIHRKVPPEYKSDMVSLATETDRTLFFDFLPLDLGKIKGFATKFQLYTVPGQVYYNATRKLVLRGVDGIVFVVDSAQDKLQENIESFQNLEDNLAEYGYKRENIPIIIQYNKRDLPTALSIEELQQYINKYNLPWTEAVANRGIGVFDSLKMIGKIVIDFLNKKYSRGSRSATMPVQQPQPQYHPQQRPISMAPVMQPPPPPPYAHTQAYSPQAGSVQQPPYQQQQFRQPPTPLQNRSTGFRPPRQPLQQPQQFMPHQYPSGTAAAQQFSPAEHIIPHHQQYPQTNIPQPPINPPGNIQGDFQDHATFEPPTPTPQPRQTMPGSPTEEDYFNYGSISIEPMRGAQQQPAMPEAPQDQYQNQVFDQVQQPPYISSGKTDLDLEIERYQREIEEKQKRSRQGQRIQEPYQPSSAPFQEVKGPSEGETGKGNIQEDYEVYNIDKQPTISRQQPPVQPVIGANDEEEMFFTSVDTDRQKKPAKRPINPRTQQQKGFLSKFFNKDMT